MGLCRGNAGNLMQHWVLSEALMELQRHAPAGARLHLVTSHSMAPWSLPRELTKPNSGETRPQFDRARLRLSAPASMYERAWAALSLRAGLPYPSSAVLAHELWAGRLSMTLCEADGTVAAEIAGWLALPETRARLQAELHRGDWRDRFRKGFAAAGTADAVFVEMDPMRFEHHVPPTGRDDRAVLFPEDLPLVVGALAEFSVPVVVQISTFSANNDNPHRVTEPVITAAMAQGDFVLSGRAQVDGNMLSLVFSRSVSLWPAPTRAVGARFAEWLRQI